MQRCYVCRKLKKRSDFHKDSGRRDGITSRCKECDKNRNRSDYFKTYRQKNMGKVRAKWMSTEALNAGKIERKPCEICGAYAEKHHEDYDKPLEVKWLCRYHHMQHHYPKDDLVKFCRKNCKHLKPTEEQQGSKKEVHWCDFYHVRVMHNGYHPRIQCVPTCEYGVWIPLERIQ